MAEVPINRNQTTDLIWKSVDWFLYDRDFRHERVNALEFDYEIANEESGKKKEKNGLSSLLNWL